MSSEGDKCHPTQRAANHLTQSITCILNAMRKPPLIIRQFVFLAALSASTVLRAQIMDGYDVTIVPANPQILAPVIARLSTNASCLGDFETTRLSQSGSAIRIEVTPVAGFCQALNLSQDVSLGHFLPGTFVVTVFAGSSPSASVLGTATFTVTDTYSSKTGFFPLVDYTDHWWNAMESGWGISIHQHPSDRLFAIWFVYSQTGLPVWYTLQPGAWTSPTVYTGPVYKTTGPYFGGPFDPNQVSSSVVGSATLRFTDASTATFAYTVEGISASKPIMRLPF